MPSHPDRVRRNYHEIELGIIEDSHLYEYIVSVRITRLQVASWMTKREIQSQVTRLLMDSIELS